MSDKKTIAAKLFELLNNHDPYSVRDNEYSEDEALQDIELHPLIVIDNLIDIANEYINERG